MILRKSTREEGFDAEKRAAKFLKKKRYKFIEANYRNRLGEIDLIFLDKNTLVFVEVKSRLTDKYGSPLDAVNTYKQNKIRSVAGVYLQSTDMSYDAVRFDVIGIEDKNIEHIIDAF